MRKNKIIEMKKKIIPYQFWRGKNLFYIPLE